MNAAHVNDSRRATATVLFAGIGSAFGDDRAGWKLIAQLSARAPAADCVALRSPAELFDRLAGVQHLHVIDACQGSGEPGTITRFDWPSPNLARVAFGGSHDFDLIETLQIATRLGMLPPRVTIWGIEIATTDGLTISREVAAAINRLCEQLVSEASFPITTCSMGFQPVHAE